MVEEGLVFNNFKILRILERHGEKERERGERGKYIKQNKLDENFFLMCVRPMIKKQKNEFSSFSKFYTTLKILRGVLI